MISKNSAISLQQWIMWATLFHQLKYEVDTDGLQILPKISQTTKQDIFYPLMLAGQVVGYYPPTDPEVSIYAHTAVMKAMDMCLGNPGLHKPNAGYVLLRAMLDMVDENSPECILEYRKPLLEKMIVFLEAFKDHCQKRIIPFFTEK